jgi:DNA topoisomerase-3
MLTTQKEGPNQGRKFWKCQNTKNAGDCGFFEWDDEPPRPPGGAGGEGGGSQKCFNVSSLLLVSTVQ